MADRAGHAQAPPQRIPGSPAPQGDNLTEAERKEAIYWARKKSVIELRAKKKAAQEAVTAIGKLLTTSRNEFKRDTGIDLKELDRIIDLAELQRGDRTKNLIDYNWMAELEGLAPGGQVSLLNAFEAAAKTPSLPKDALDWEMEGRNAYNQGLECKPPAECHAINVTDFTRGWHAMEERTIWAMAGSKVVDRDPDKHIVGAPPLEAEPGDEEAAEGATVCATCADDGTGLAEGVDICPDCTAEYEPREPVAESVH